MKNKLLKSLFAVLLIPVLFFAGCKEKDPLPAIDLATYMNEEMTVSYYQLEAKSTKDLSFITDTKLDEENLNSQQTLFGCIKCLLNQFRSMFTQQRQAQAK